MTLTYDLQPQPNNSPLLPCCLEEQIRAIAFRRATFSSNGAWNFYRSPYIKTGWFLIFSTIVENCGAWEDASSPLKGCDVASYCITGIIQRLIWEIGWNFIWNLRVMYIVVIRGNIIKCVTYLKKCTSTFACTKRPQTSLNNNIIKWLFH